jgi:N-acetylmuramoyl-L-alanine amidase
MKLFNVEAMANAIVKGLTGKLPADKPPEIPTPTGQSTNPQAATNPSISYKSRDGNGKALIEDGITGPATEARR